MSALLILTAAVAGTAAAMAATFVIGMRRKSPMVLTLVRRSSRFMKPLVLRSAGRAGSPTGVVEHRGRTSGRTYETPVVAARTDTGFVIALPYGPTTDWLKNVMAVGGTILRVGGEAVILDNPRLVPLDTVAHHFAAREHRLHRQFSVGDALVLDTRTRFPLTAAGGDEAAVPMRSEGP